jgi:hypothetical protein
VTEAKRPAGSDDRTHTTEWAVAKRVLTAHSRTGRALERCLLLQSLRDEPLTTDEELAISLEQAIADHEEILETLCAAREAVDVETPE